MFSSTWKITKNDLCQLVESAYDVRESDDKTTLSLIPKKDRGILIIIKRTGKSHFRVNRIEGANNKYFRLDSFDDIHDYLCEQGVDQMRLPV